jgi:hypothetical protein
VIRRDIWVAFERMEGDWRQMWKMGRCEIMSDRIRKSLEAEIRGLFEPQLAV